MRRLETLLVVVKQKEKPRCFMGNNFCFSSLEIYSKREREREKRIWPTLDALQVKSHSTHINNNNNNKVQEFNAQP